MKYDEFAKKLDIKIKSGKLDLSRLKIKLDYEVMVENWWTDVTAGGMQQINGEVLQRTNSWDFDIGEYTHIGEIRCIYISGFDSFKNRFLDMRETADTFNQDLYDAVYAVTNEEGELKEEYMPGNSVLYVERFYINPQFRGNGVGLAVFPMILDILGRDTGVNVIIPAPTELDGKKRIEETDIRYRAVIEQMESFLRQMGYKELVKENKIWVRYSG